jgi:hypothetical protein
MEGLEDANQNDWDSPAPDWSAHRYGTGYGYGLMTVHNDTHLTWKLYRSRDGGLEDEFTLVNENHY